MKSYVCVMDNYNLFSITINMDQSNCQFKTKNKRKQRKKKSGFFSNFHVSTFTSEMIHKDLIAWFASLINQMERLK